MAGPAGVGSSGSGPVHFPPAPSPEDLEFSALHADRFSGARKKVLIQSGGLGGHVGIPRSSSSWTSSLCLCLFFCGQFMTLFF